MLHLPQHLLDYRITSSSKTEDLFILGRLFSEVGDYASTIQQRDYTLMGRMCRTRLRKIERELLRRSAIPTPDDILIIPPVTTSSTVSSLVRNLSTLSVSELETLYRQRPHRIEARIAAGREHLTLFFESRIIAELSRRTPIDLTEQLKIDYCLIIHRIETANLSAILNLPLGDPKDSLPFDPYHTYTHSELIAFLTLYQSPRTLIEREILIETVDYSLDLLAATSPSDLQSLANLTANLAELQRRKMAHCPAWLPRLLTTTITCWRRSPSVPDTDMVFPLLTAALINRTPALERQAQRIINRCHQHLLSIFENLDTVYTIGNLSHLFNIIKYFYITTIYSSYIYRFRVHRIASIWNYLTTYFLLNLDFIFIRFSSLNDLNENVVNDSQITLSLSFFTQNLVSLLQSANELINFTKVSYTLYTHLLLYLKKIVPSEDLIANTYFCYINRSDCLVAKVIY